MIWSGAELRCGASTPAPAAIIAAARCAQWFWHQGRTPDPTTWKVRDHRIRPFRVSVTHLLPFEAVVWLTWGQSTTTPWVGRGPASWASLAAKLTAESERSLGDEAAGPVAQLLPIPQDPSAPDGDLDGDEDPLAALRADVTAARGKALLVETTAAGFSEGRGAAPQKDWVAERLGPHLPPPWWKQPATRSPAWSPRADRT